MTGLPAVSHLRPDVILSDRQWDRVIAALRARGTKADDEIAKRIDAEVQFFRRQHATRLRSAADDPE